MLVVVNHISFLDGALLMAALSEIPVFAINTAMANRWWLRPFRRVANLYPLDPTNPLAIKDLIGKINAGQPCVIFPEGRLSVTGALMKIYAGPAYIADRTGATILPVRLDGPELTPFTRLKQGQVTRHWFPKIIITLCPPRTLDVDPALRGKARRQVANLQLYDIMSDMVFRTTDWGATLFAALLRARWRHGWRYPVLEDTSGTHIDYMKLVAGALVLGRRFAAQTEPGERVGVLVPNVNAAAVVFFALQAFGRVPAMLNFSAGPANLEAAVVTAQIKLVVSSGEFVAKAKLEPSIAAIGGHARFLWLEDLRAPGRHRRPPARPVGRPVRRPHPPACGVRRDDPAVVLFTSGSEGRPKGVVLSHRNILANCAQISARVDFNQLDKVFNALPVFHSFGLTGAMLLPILGGVAVYMYPSPLHYRIVPELVYDSNSTIIFGTNSFLKGYGRMGDPYDFRSLRYAFAGAEAIQDETQQPWFDKFGMRILTGYGATETAPVLSLNTPMHYRSGTVGRLLPGDRAQARARGRPGPRRPAVGQGPQHHAGLPALRAARRARAARGRLVRHRRHRRARRAGLRHHPRPRQALRQDRRRDGEPGCGRGLRPPHQPRPRPRRRRPARPAQGRAHRPGHHRPVPRPRRPAQGRARGRRQRADAPGRGPAPSRAAAAGHGEDGLSRACRRS